MLYRALDESQRRQQAGKASKLRHDLQTGRQVAATDILRTGFSLL